MSLSDELEKRQQEKLAVRPIEVDWKAALAVRTQALQDHMDDKYLALFDEIGTLSKRLGRLEIRRARWWTRLGRRLRRMYDNWCYTYPKEYD